MTLSLRGRLLIGVISLVLIGLLVLNVAIYASLQSFLIGRVDAQMRAAVEEVAAALGAPTRGQVQRTAFPVGTVAELLAPDGSVVTVKGVGTGFGSTALSVSPVLPKTLPNTQLDVPAEPFTVADLLPYRGAREPPCQTEALKRRKIMRKARSKKQRPALLAELERDPSKLGSYLDALPDNEKVVAFAKLSASVVTICSGSCGP